MYLLIGIAVADLAVHRVAAPLLKPAKGKPPSWHTVLDWAGIFVFYFAGVLAAMLLGQRVLAALRERRDARTVCAYVLVAAATVLAAILLGMQPSDDQRLAVELVTGAAMLALVPSAFGSQRDLGAEIGTIVFAIPLLVRTVAFIGGRFLWPDNTFDGMGVTMARVDVMTMSLAALVSPYVFAPRPFARAVTRPGPILFAMAVAAGGAVIARNYYPKLIKVAMNGIGVELADGRGDPRMSVYLLAIATLAWTLAACATARAQARREIGAGIALIVLGAYVFKTGDRKLFETADHYLLPLLGMAILCDATARVRDDEAADLPLGTETPTISDAAWSRYIGSLAQALKRAVDDVHSLTTRGEGGLVSSLVVGEKHGLTVRTRIERIDGAVIALDVVIGREIDEVRGATLCLWAIPARGHGPNPSGPPAAPLLKTGDAAFDQRFKSRGSALACNKLLDDTLRARAVATLDGWLAYWEPEGLRYRVYPGRGAPLDHPIPLSDLAMERPATGDRLVAVIELLVEIAARGVKPQAFDGPTNIEALAVGDSTDVEGEPAPEAADSPEPTETEGRAVESTDVDRKAVE